MDDNVSSLCDRRRTAHLALHMGKYEIFRSSQVTTDCDQCSGRVDLIKGGVCPRCRRILCYRHLHGSWLRRLIADIGGNGTCVQCRSRDKT